MIKITVKGPQGSGKSLIASMIRGVLEGRRLPYTAKKLKVLHLPVGMGVGFVNKDYVELGYDIVVIEKQSK